MDVVKVPGDRFDFIGFQARCAGNRGINPAADRLAIRRVDDAGSVLVPAVYQETDIPGRDTNKYPGHATAICQLVHPLSVGQKPIGYLALGGGDTLLSLPQATQPSTPSAKSLAVRRQVSTVKRIAVPSLSKVSAVDRNAALMFFVEAVFVEWITIGLEGETASVLEGDIVKDNEFIRACDEEAKGTPGAPAVAAWVNVSPVTEAAVFRHQLASVIERRESLELLI